MLTKVRQFLLRVLQRREPLYIQELIPKPTIETFDEAILHWPSRPNETQLHAVFHRPCF
jgi:hypothetical protein